MPLITFNTVEGALSVEQKTEISKALTETVANVLGEKLTANTWVIINEAPEGNFHIAGHSITAKAIQKAMK